MRRPLPTCRLVRRQRSAWRRTVTKCSRGAWCRWRWQILIHSFPAAAAGGHFCGTAVSRTFFKKKFFKVEILINTEGKRIFSGLSADVDIETKHFNDVIKVPSQAVLARAPDTLPPHIRDLPEVDKTKAMVPVVYKYVDGKSVVVRRHHY